MTKSQTYTFYSDEVTSLVTLSEYNQQHAPVEVIIVNDSEEILYLGDKFILEDNTGMPLAPNAGIALSIGSGDELWGYATAEVSLNVMILAGKGR